MINKSTDKTPNIIPLPPCEIMVSACVLAGGVSACIYRSLANVPQKYSELVSGRLAMTGTTKLADLALLFGFTAMAIAGLFIFLRTERSLARLSCTETVISFRQSLTYACLPAVYVLAAMLAVQRFDQTLLSLSAWAVAAVGALGGITAWRSTRSTLTDDAPTVVSTVPFIAFCAGLAVPLGVLGSYRLVPWLWRPGPEFVVSAAGLFAAAALVAGAGMAWVADRGLGLLLRRAAVLFQLPLVLGYLACIPIPWLAGGKPMANNAYGWALWLLVLILVGLACWDILRRWPRVFRAGEGLPGLVSPLALAALLVAFKCSLLSTYSVTSDDYHVGESLLSWWGWFSHGLVPFRDLDPVHGLVSLLPGAVSFALFDGTAVTHNGAQAVLYALLATLWLSVLARFAPVGLAFCLLLLFSPTPFDYFAIQAVSVVRILCICAAAVADHQRLAVLVLLAIGPALVLFATGDGGLVLMALAPVAVWCLWTSSAQTNARRFLAQIGCILAIWGLLFALTPAGIMLWGSLRYTVENAAVNSIANGIAWADPAIDPGGINWLLELTRNSYILVLIGIAFVCVPVWRLRHKPAARRSLALTITAALFILLYILRAAVRIDPGAPSRLGHLCFWALLLGLPVLCWGAGNRGKNVLSMVMVFMAGLVGSYWITPRVGTSKLTDALVYSPLDRVDVGNRLVDGVAIGLPNLGRGVFEPGHIDRLKSLKAILDGLLTKDETYLDLTNRNAHYFYFNRPPAISAGAFYNLPAESQQRRAIARLAANPPPAILIDADNLLHDGGPASLRCHHLYRRFILAYVPVRLGRFSFLLRPDRYLELAEGMLTLPEEARFIPSVRDSRVESSILDAAFAPASLQGIPQSWGASWPSLVGGISKVADLSVHKATLNDLHRLPDGRFESTGLDPFLVFPVTEMGISGAKAGLLVLDFSSDALVGKSVTLQIFFAVDGQPFDEIKSLHVTTSGGRLIVPLDAFPRWLLSGRVDAVRIDVDNPDTCRVFNLTNVALYQRNLAKAAQ